MYEGNFDTYHYQNKSFISEKPTFTKYFLEKFERIALPTCHGNIFLLIIRLFSF